MLKDYYEILGITEFDTADKIKSAYRILARKWHPDVAGNTSDVLERFKEINEAYEVLSNNVKKSEYDRARQFYDYAKNGKSTCSNPQNETFKQQAKDESVKNNKKNNSFSFNWEDIISGKKCKEAFKKDEKVAPKRGRDLYADVEISYIEAIEGVVKSVNMLQTNTCPKCRGNRFANGATCTHCHGKGTISEYKKFTVKIPNGIKNNSKIRLAGEGLSGINGGKNGDLYITIHISDDEVCKTKGVDIFKKVCITPYEAVLGCSVKVDTPDGKVEFSVSPRTQNGQKIRLAGCGIMQNNKVGDMIITIEIRIPESLTSEELDLYKRLSEISSVKDRK